MSEINDATRPRGGWYHGWNIVAVCILSTATCNALTYNCYSLFLKDWSAQLHTSISHLQLALPTMLISCSILSPIAGVFADKYPARRLFGCGLSALAILYMVVGSITAPWQIVVLYGLVAPIALTLAASITTNALISRWFVRHRGLALGLSAFGLGLAGVVLPPIIAALLPTIGWRMIWRGAGLLTGLLIMPLVVWVVRDRPSERYGLHYLRADGKISPPQHDHSGGTSQLSWRDVFSRKSFWLLIGIYLPMMALYGGCGQNVGPYVANHGLDRQYAGLLISVMSATHVAATLLLGMLSDRFGNRLPLVGLALVNVVGAALLAFGSGLPGMIVGYALVGSGGAVFTLLAAALAVEFGPDGIGRAFGVAMFFLPIGAFAPFAIARIQELTGSYGLALMAIAILVIISGVLSLLLRERRGGENVLESTSAVAGTPG